jgi:hypothetical protein
MNYEQIKELLKKYFAGETSLDDEKILRGYFASPDVDARLVRYAALFQFFEHEKTIELNREATEKVMPQSPLQVAHVQKTQRFDWGKTLRYAAAIALLVVGSGVLFKTFWQKPAIEQIAQVKNHKAKVIVFDENDDPEKALAVIEKALMKTSKKMKKGTDEAFEGLEKVQKASELLHN